MEREGSSLKRGRSSKKAERTNKRQKQSENLPGVDEEAEKHKKALREEKDHADSLRGKDALLLVDCSNFFLFFTGICISAFILCFLYFQTRETT